jgi:DNA repair protein RadC
MPETDSPFPAPEAKQDEGSAPAVLQDLVQGGVARRAVSRSPNVHLQTPAVVDSEEALPGTDDDAEGRRGGAGSVNLTQTVPEGQRPRERLLRSGSEALTTGELLAILLRTGTVGQNVVMLAENLLATFGTLEALSRATPQELTRMNGLGAAKACQLAAAFALGVRAAREAVLQLTMDTPERVYDFLAAEMRALSTEVVQVLILNTRYNLIAKEQVHTGAVNRTLFAPDVILRAVIARGGSHFIVVHNHPSGDPSPSEADRRATARLRDAANLLEVPMLDHVIIGTAIPGVRLGYYSFREAGVL